MDRLKTSVEGKRLSEGESDENSKLPPFQLSGVVCCLTLRKILYSRWNPHLKFSFGLIRGLYKDSIRPQKVQKSKSRTTLKNNSATALEKNIENAGKSLSEKKIGIKTIRTDFVRKSSKLAIFGIHVHRAPMHKVVQIFKKKLSTALFIFKVNGLRHNSFKSALKALTSCAIKARIKSYFSVFSQKPLSPIILITSLNSVLSNLKTSIFFEILKFRAGPNYLKISRIYNTHYLYKLADAFT